MDAWDRPDLPSPSGGMAAQEPDKPSRRAQSLLREIFQLVLIVMFVRLSMDTLLPRYVVDGASMEPTFSTSERVIVDRVTMLLGGPSRGDVVVLDSPRDHELLIKRVIGLPGEIIALREGRVYVNGRLLEEPHVAEFCTSRSCNGTWELGPDEYFVLGDNRSHSLDSHSFGPVQRSAIKGVARVRYWPPDELELFTAPEY